MSFNDGHFVRSSSQGETENAESSTLGTNEPGRSVSAQDSVASTFNRPGGEGSARASTESINTVRILNQIIDDFRNRRFSKPRTVARLTAALSFDPKREEPQKEAAFSQYLASIESIERLSVEATQRGQHAAVGLGGQSDHDFTNDQPGAPVQIQADNGARGKETDEFNRSCITEKSAKRGRQSNDSKADDGGDGEEDSDVISNKKKRLFESDMPWYGRERSARESANPSCAKTREILIKFARDYATVKHWIITSQSAPSGFPPVEWDNIIKGKFVNLDNVLSSLHHVSPIKENTGRVGSTENCIGRTEPNRKVQTNGEWTSAWNATIKATSFAFPHREDELREYGEYMDREFSSKVVSAHRKLILYDEAVRGEVAGGQRVLLTDRAKFSYIYSAIVLTF